MGISVLSSRWRARGRTFVIAIRGALGSRIGAPRTLGTRLAASQNLAKVQPRGQDWAGLIAHTARGEEEALAALYDDTSALVNGLALRILGDAGAAEEVTADVYLQIWRRAVTYDPARGAPLGWLLTLARS